MSRASPSCPILAVAFAMCASGVWVCGHVEVEEVWPMCGLVSFGYAELLGGDVPASVPVDREAYWLVQVWWEDESTTVTCFIRLSP